ncbi:HalOD1 output domain-containing protein [Haladaptatus sp.]|uniref:HalOD1 output domain-containing protein n=1 Tax=Haladaptatus sp. TaxID=1973141 RepID=UPI003C5E5773
MSKEDSSVHGNSTDENDDTIRIRYDWDTTAPSTAVAETVARAAGSEPNEIEPLYTHIDPESLDALVSSRKKSRCETTNSISFSYDKYDVTVRSSGEVAVRDGRSRKRNTSGG